MPIPVCKFARANSSKAFKGISKYGYCASKKETYFGFKLHSPYKEIKIIGDKGYISDSLENELINERGILLLALQRKNSKKGVCKNLKILYQKSEDV